MILNLIALILLIIEVSIAAGVTPDCKLDDIYQQRIAKDLAPFSDGITQLTIERMKAKGYPNVRIRNKTVYEQGDIYPSIQCVIAEILPYLPDMDFVFNFGDGPVIAKNPCPPGQDWRDCICDPDYVRPDHGFFIFPGQLGQTGQPIFELLPVFSMATISACFKDILFPSYYHLTQEIIHQRIPWKEKTFKAFWRGASTGGIYNDTRYPFSIFHRQRLVQLCEKEPLCDAHFVSWFTRGVGQQRPQIQKALVARYGKSYPKVDYRKLQKFKILIDIDGNSYSQRTPKLMRTGSAIFRIGAFEDIATIALSPWVHYVPVKMDLSDFDKQLQWAQSHDAQLEQIAERGKKTVEKVITYEKQKCYVLRLLLKYGQLVAKGRSLEDK